MINSLINMLLVDLDAEIKENGQLSDNTMDLLQKLVVDLHERVEVSFINEIPNYNDGDDSRNLQ